ncbi:hypothetical protein HLB23_25810 [Nocardia uniformis]|uniref:Uncharacterized protein n=1 Tax=Nocardia uniformis TaxID=53432 RepID=A0A849C3J5_9NOCA|nr:hypothetical protein [Nocardia uniformis]NNH73232.1 hypothetical protein [Nocardia uniformis]
MTITYTGDPAALQSSANNTAACLGELESHLKALAATQDELHTAVVSQGAGNAIYNTLGNAHVRGLSLAGTLQQIVDGLSDTGVKVDLEDLEGAARVNAAMGDDGVVDGGAGASSWTSAGTAVDSKVDTATW